MLRTGKEHLETLRDGPGYCRKGVAATLLWRRFTLTRSLLLPVWQLEEPTPSAFRKRRKVLGLLGDAFRFARATR